MSVTVTSAAIESVRSTIVRYTGCSMIVRKFSSEKPRTISPLNSSRVQNEAMSRTTSEPRYTTPSHPSGAASRAPTRNHRRRHSRRESTLPLDLRPGLDPLAVVDADVAAVVAAVARRRGPELHLVVVARVVDVVGVAERLVARGPPRRGVGRRPADPLRDLRLHLRRLDPVHPLHYAI